jgi:hypothetical protein
VNATAREMRDEIEIAKELKSEARKQRWQTLLAKRASAY